MTEDEKRKLLAWMTNTGLRIDNDLQDARNDFRQNESTWLAFRLSLAAERKTFFDVLSAQLYALLNL